RGHSTRQRCDGGMRPCAYEEPAHREDVLQLSGVQSRGGHPNTVQAAHAIDDALHVEGVVILGRASEWHDMRHQQDAIPGGGYLLDELRDLVQQHAAVLTLGPIASYQWAQVQADHTRGVGWPEL